MNHSPFPTSHASVRSLVTGCGFLWWEIEPKTTMCEINSKTKLCIKQKRSSVLFDRWCQLCSSIFLVFHQVIKSQLARSSVCEVPYEKPLQLEFVSSAQSKEPIGDVWTWETRNGKVTKKQRGLKQGSREETKTKTWNCFFAPKKYTSNCHRTVGFRSQNLHFDAMDKIRGWNL